MNIVQYWCHHQYSYTSYSTFIAKSLLNSCSVPGRVLSIGKSGQWDGQGPSLHSGWGWVVHIKIMEKQAQFLVICYEENKWVGEAMPVADKEHNDRQVGKEGHSEDFWAEAPKDRKPVPIRGDSKGTGQCGCPQEQGGRAERWGGAEWAGPGKSREGVRTSF